MPDLKREIKELIISSLNLEDVSIDDIDDNEPLFVEGLGLDSIDALELGVAIKKRFSVVLGTDSSETRAHFASVATLAAFITNSTHIIDQQTQ